MVTLNELLHLSPENEEGFLEFERIAREEMNRHIATLGPDDSWEDARVEYMSAVQAAFEEFAPDGVGGLASPDKTFELDDFNWFNQAVKKVITRLQVRALRRTAADWIALPAENKTSLVAEIGRLKNRVARASDLTDERKKALSKRLDDLLQEIEKPRLNLTRFAVAVAAVAGALVGVESAAIKGPETLVAILDTVHLVVGKEAERRALFDHYRQAPAIEHQPQGGFVRARATPRESFSSDLDDEIPF